MTAEVTVLNRHAVALAADSAVTISTGDQKKVFNSVNKLFRLSLTYPVGVMVYGAATMFSVPWETIIKLYRNERKDKYDTLEEYANCFFDFLTHNGYNFFPESYQEKYVSMVANSIVEEICDCVLEGIKEDLDKEEKTEEDIEKTAKNIIDGYCKDIDKLDDLNNSLTTDEILGKYRNIIEEAIKNHFEKFKLQIEEKELISISVAKYFTKKHFSEAVSGIVFAGFGEKEYFPSLYAYRLDAIVNNKLRLSNDGASNVTVDNGAHIRRFAQGDMVATFIEGIDPKQKRMIDGYLGEITNELPDIIINSLRETKLKAEEIEQIVKKLKDSSKSFLKKFRSDLVEFRSEQHISPILELVSLLPREELALMAETLVNLTSFKQRMTMGTETVGGPIDVAVITKGDGFTWIKRKGMKI